MGERHYCYYISPYYKPPQLLHNNGKQAFVQVYEEPFFNKQEYETYFLCNMQHLISNRDIIYRTLTKLPDLVF